MLTNLPRPKNNNRIYGWGTNSWLAGFFCFDATYMIQFKDKESIPKDLLSYFSTKSTRGMSVVYTIILSWDSNGFEKSNQVKFKLNKDFLLLPKCSFLKENETQRHPGLQDIKILKF